MDPDADVVYEAAQLVVPAALPAVLAELSKAVLRARLPPDAGAHAIHAFCARCVAPPPHGHHRTQRRRRRRRPPVPSEALAATARSVARRGVCARPRPPGAVASSTTRVAPAAPRRAPPFCHCSYFAKLAAEGGDAPTAESR